MAETPEHHLQPDSPPESRVAEEKKHHTAEPWFLHFGSPDHFVMGLRERYFISGNTDPNLAPFIAIFPKGLDQEHANAELVVRSPQMLRVLVIVQEFFLRLEEHADPDDPLTKMRAMYHAPIHTVLDPLMDEFRKAGVL